MSSILHTLVRSFALGALILLGIAAFVIVFIVQLILLFVS